MLVGEVWLVAGQSNAFNQMDPTVMWEDYTDAYPGWKAQFECPNVRVVISTPKQAQGGQADYYQAGMDYDLKWIVCKSANESQVKKISPLAFFFGKKLSEAKGCPVGITLVGMGGTAAGFWMTSEAQARIKAIRGGDVPFGYTEPKTGENLSKYLTRFDTVAARGCVWAQGETDASVGGADRYRYSLQCLIDDWRSAAHRNNASFPVVVCSPATYGGGPNGQTPYEGNWEGEGKYSTLRLELEMAATDLLSNIGIVHAIDLAGNATKGYARALHPTQKEELAARCVCAARNLAYKENVAYRCPNPVEAYLIRARRRSSCVSRRPSP